MRLWISSTLCALSALICSQQVCADNAPSNESTEQLSLVFLLGSNNFDELEKITGSWLQSYELQKMSGDDLYDRFRQALPSKLSVTWQDHLEKWVKARPKSYAANYLLGRFLSKMGWELRGNKFASETSTQQSLDFKKYEVDAAIQLHQSAKLYSRPYLTYCSLIDVARALRNGQEVEYLRLAEQTEPAGYIARSIFIIGLAPKWQGSVEAVRAFVATAKKSPMKPNDKARLEADGYELEAEDLNLNEHSVAAMEMYRKAYFTFPDADTLWRLVEAADIAKKAELVERAIELYGEVLSINPRHVGCRGARGYLLETKGDLKGALADYVVAAEGGGDWAQNRIGWWYLTGYAVPKNYDSAENYFRKAAAQGNDTAKENLKILEAARRQAK